MKQTIETGLFYTFFTLLLYFSSRKELFTEISLEIEKCFLHLVPIFPSNYHNKSNEARLY